MQVIQIDPYRTARALAYDYAVAVLTGEFQTDDHDELVAVATAYALEFWEDWLPDAEALHPPPGRRG